MNDEKYVIFEVRFILVNLFEEISNFVKEVVKLEDLFEKEEGELEKVCEGLKGKI